MGKVIQKGIKGVESDVSTFFSGDSPATTLPSTTSITPTSISPFKGSIKSNAKSLGIIAQGALDVINTQTNITSKRRQLAFKQQQLVATAKARAELLTMIDNTVNTQQASTDNIASFNADAARDAVRADIFNYISGESGVLIDNATLRLALDEADARITALIPKTQFNIGDGVGTFIHTRDGKTEVTSVVVDPQQVRLNSLGALADTHPHLANKIATNPNTTDEQKIQQGTVVTDKLAAIELAKTQIKYVNAQNPFIAKPEPVRKALAQQAYYATLSKHSNLAITEGSTNLNLDDQVPGAMENFAKSYISDMQASRVNDSALAEMSEVFGVDLYGLTDTAFQKYVTSKANFIASLDTLNVKKQSAAGAVASVTEAYNNMRAEDVDLLSSLTPSDRVIIKLGGADIAITERMIIGQQKRSPTAVHIAQALQLANSRWHGIGNAISAIEDNDEPETHKQVQEVMAAFYVDAKVWAKRDYIHSPDMAGFVAAMTKIKDQPAFQRLEPDNFILLEQLYQKTKADPKLTPMFNKLEAGKSIDEETLQIYRELLAKPEPEGLF